MLEEINKAIVFENFLSEQDCKYLVETAIGLDVWENTKDASWNLRTISYETMIKHNTNAANIMINAKDNCSEKIKNFYNIKDPIYADLIQIVRWFPGMEQPPHADDMTNTDVKGFEERAFGSIIYLNDNYSGGHTFYPNFNFEIIPKQGNLAIHPGDPEHLHGVTKIENNTRYTLVSFWRYQKIGKNG